MQALGDFCKRYLRDGVGCRFLQTYGIAPLYVEDPQDMTQAEGDEQYNPRFMLNVLVQANRVEHVEMDTFTDAELSVHPLA